MKYLGFSEGHLIDGFCILPSLDVSWINEDENYKVIDLV